MIAVMLWAPHSVAAAFPRFMLFVALVLMAWQALMRRRHIEAVLWTVPALTWVYYYHDANNWLQLLGADSFTETTAPTFSEVTFWLSTMGQVLRPVLSPALLALYMLGAAAVALSIECAARLAGMPQARLHRHVQWFAAAVAALSVAGVSAHAVVAFAENTALEEEIRKNFTIPAGLQAVAQRPLALVVYIGESTTAMNWGLYGYPRATTPELAAIAAQDAGLIVFRNVYSTHTHTSQSLFEALSVPARSGEETKPITSRQRVSAAAILQAAQVRTALYSNQGRAGTWNMMAPLIFAGAPQTYSVDGRLAGNMDFNLARPLDGDFFAGVVGHEAHSGTLPAVTVLHSRAGHGDYLDNIAPAYRAPVDRMLAGAGRAAVAGAASGKLADIEAYDSAMAYVDHAVALRLKDVAALERPAVLIYFSDHGESVGDNRGHDAARFLFEMLRVPFIVYFNAAARQSFPDLFGRYRALALAGRPATLAQLPATLFDLLNLRITGGAVAPHGPVLGEEAVLAPVFVRDVGSRFTSLVDLNAVPQRWDGAPHDFSGDRTLRAAVAGRRPRAAPGCAGDAGSFLAARRGVLALGCIAIDVIEQGGQVSLALEGTAKPGLPLVLSAAAAGDAAVWLRLTGEAPGDCDRVALRLGEAGLARRAALEVDASHGADCVAALSRAQVVPVAGLPQKEGVGCATALGGGEPFTTVPDCLALDGLIAKARAEGFGAVAVAAGHWPALAAAPAAQGLAWFVRDVDPSEAAYGHAARLSFALDDPNRQE